MSEWWEFWYTFRRLIAPSCYDHAHIGPYPQGCISTFVWESHDTFRSRTEEGNPNIEAIYTEDLKKEKGKKIDPVEETKEKWIRPVNRAHSFKCLHCSKSIARSLGPTSSWLCLKLTMRRRISPFLSRKKKATCLRLIGCNGGNQAELFTIRDVELQNQYTAEIGKKIKAFGERRYNFHENHFHVYISQANYDSDPSFDPTGFCWATIDFLLVTRWVVDVHGIPESQRDFLCTCHIRTCVGVVDTVQFICAVMSSWIIRTKRPSARLVFFCPQFCQSNEIYKWQPVWKADMNNANIPAVYYAMDGAREEARGGVVF